MSFNNISKINIKKEKNKIYVFDIPSIDDEDAITTYLMFVSKDGNKRIEKLTDFDSFFELLGKNDTEIIRYKSKEYDLFIEDVASYMFEIKASPEKAMLDQDDISIINKEFKGELEKKGNTAILKQILKQK